MGHDIVGVREAASTFVVGPDVKEHPMYREPFLHRVRPVPMSDHFRPHDVETSVGPPRKGECFGVVLSLLMAHRVNCRDDGTCPSGTGRYAVLYREGKEGHVRP